MVTPVDPIEQCGCAESSQVLCNGVEERVGPAEFADHGKCYVDGGVHESAGHATGHEDTEGYRETFADACHEVVFLKSGKGLRRQKTMVKRLQREAREVSD